MYSNLKTVILGDYVKIISIDLKSSSEFENKKKIIKNTDKLSNNLIRAKNKIIDIGLANDFCYYFTVTFNTSYDRYSLDDVHRYFRSKIRILSEASNQKIDYLIVPEQHKDGAWHFHGFLNHQIDEFIYTNQHGHPDIRYLNELGWVNLQFINDKVRISHYITKYIEKNLGKNIDLSRHSFYATQGLKRGSEDLNLIYNNEYFNTTFFDFKSDYCFKKIITLEEYNRIKTFLTKL